MLDFLPLNVVVFILMHIKKHLSFNSLRSMISTRLQSLSEHRQLSRIKHSIHDVFMSAFAMMFFSGSFYPSISEEIR